MKEIEGLFSKQAETYAAFRPTYPDELYEFLYTLTDEFDTAWDCATGNGQVAVQLAKKFNKVYATDISAQQLQHAPQKPNIEYEICRVEETPFANNTFDLITVGTAIHWFDFEAFYAEVRRVAKPGVAIAAWAYAPCICSPAADAIYEEFSSVTLKDYWNPERKYGDDEYRSIPFPFEEIKAPKINLVAQWTYEQYIGYINSWSSVQNYIDKNGINPITLIEKEIKQHWGEEIKEIIFPLFMRAGRV